MKKLAFSVIAIFVLSLAWFTWINNQYQDEPMINLINEVRKEAGAQELQYSEALSQTARKKACQMKEEDWFDHQDRAGNFSWHYLQEAEIPYQFAGENIAQNMDSTREAMQGWMQSPPHKANILDARFNQVGYAACGQFMVQHFAKI